MANFSVLCSKRFALLLSLLLLTAWQVSFIAAEGPTAPLKPLSGSSRKADGVVDQAKAFRAIRRPFGNTRFAMFGLGSLAVGGCLYFSHVTMTSSNALKLILQGTSVLLYCYAAAQMFFLGQRFAALHTLFVLVLPIVFTPLMFFVIPPLRHLVVQEAGDSPFELSKLHVDAAHFEQAKAVVANTDSPSSSAAGIMTNQKEDASPQAVVSPSRPKGSPSISASGTQRPNTSFNPAPSTSPAKQTNPTYPNNASQTTSGSTKVPGAATRTGTQIGAKTGVGASPAVTNSGPATTTTEISAAALYEDAAVEAVQKDLPEKITADNAVAAIEAFYAGCDVLEKNLQWEDLRKILSGYRSTIKVYILTSVVPPCGVYDTFLCKSLLEAFEKKEFTEKLFYPLSAKGGNHVFMIVKDVILSRTLKKANEAAKGSTEDLAGLTAAIKLILDCIPDSSKWNLEKLRNQPNGQLKNNASFAFELIVDYQQKIQNLLTDDVISGMNAEELTTCVASLKGIPLKKISGKEGENFSTLIQKLETEQKKPTTDNSGSDKLEKPDAVVALETKFPDPNSAEITDDTVGSAIDAIYEALGHLQNDGSVAGLKEAISLRLNALKAFINKKCTEIDTSAAVVASLEKLNQHDFTESSLSLGGSNDDIFLQEKSNLVALKLRQAIKDGHQPLKGTIDEIAEQTANAVAKVLACLPETQGWYLHILEGSGDKTLAAAVSAAYAFIQEEHKTINDINLDDFTPEPTIEQLTSAKSALGKITKAKVNGHAESFFFTPMIRKLDGKIQQAKSTASRRIGAETSPAAADLATTMIATSTDEMLRWLEKISSCTDDTLPNKLPLPMGIDEEKFDHLLMAMKIKTQEEKKVLLHRIHDGKLVSPKVLMDLIVRLFMVDDVSSIVFELLRDPNIPMSKLFARSCRGCSVDVVLADTQSAKRKLQLTSELFNAVFKDLTPTNFRPWLSMPLIFKQLMDKAREENTALALRIYPQLEGAVRLPAQDFPTLSCIEPLLPLIFPLSSLRDEHDERILLASWFYLQLANMQSSKEVMPKEMEDKILDILSLVEINEQSMELLVPHLCPSFLKGWKERETKVGKAIIDQFLEISLEFKKMNYGVDYRKAPIEYDSIAIQLSIKSLTEIDSVPFFVYRPLILAFIFNLESQGNYDTSQVPFNGIEYSPCFMEDLYVLALAWYRKVHAFLMDLDPKQKSSLLSYSTVLTSRLLAHFKEKGLNCDVLSALPILP